MKITSQPYGNVDEVIVHTQLHKKSNDIQRSRLHDIIQQTMTRLYKYTLNCTTRINVNMSCQLWVEYNT